MGYIAMVMPSSIALDHAAKTCAACMDVQRAVVRKPSWQTATSDFRRRGILSGIVPNLGLSTLSESRRGEASRFVKLSLGDGDEDDAQ
jgi:hypothetical protein